MATLKICTLSHTTWITNVTKVNEVKSFSIPSDGGNEDILALAGRIDANVICLAEFSGETIGKVLRVEIEGHKTETWVVPADSCYLMSDAGKTIDRV